MNILCLYYSFIGNMYFIRLILKGRSQWPCGLRRRSAATRLLRLWVRIAPGAWMFVSCECCVLSRRGLWDELITCPEESYRVWCVVVCDLETSWMRRPWPTRCCRAKNQKKKKQILKETPLPQHTFPFMYFSFFARLWQNGTSENCCRKINKWTYVRKRCIYVNLNSYSL
jgi:hypothetical protein